MTGSIIRRYARYHGCFSAGHDDRKSVLERVKEIQKARKYERGEQGRMMIVEQLTLIVAAEMLTWSMGQTKPRVVQNALDIERCALLLRAGIDPEQWAKVTG